MEQERQISTDGAIRQPGPSRRQDAEGGVVGAVLGLQRQAGNATATLAVQRGLKDRLLSLTGRRGKDEADLHDESGANMGWTPQQAEALRSGAFWDLPQTEQLSMMAGYARAYDDARLRLKLDALRESERRGGGNIRNNLFSQAVQHFLAQTRAWVQVGKQQLSDAQVAALEARRGQGGGGEADPTAYM